MLFSDAAIANYINANFEPAWVNVRPVPMVKIDFGAGNVVTRTLNGNVATWVCDSDGRALDIVPGIYSPKDYAERLAQFRLLHAYYRDAAANNRSVVLASYHKQQSEQLAQKLEPYRLAAVDMADISKMRVESKIKILLVPPGEPSLWSLGRKTVANLAAMPAAAGSGPAGWGELVEDTKLNESLRHRMIHDVLSNGQIERPNTLTKWLYKDVLHADLDDPYLGLGPLLFAGYPFSKG